MTDMKIKRDLQKTAETPVLNTGFMEITGVSAHNKSAREESCGGKHQQMWITQHTHTHTPGSSVYLLRAMTLVAHLMRWMTADLCVSAAELLTQKQRSSTDR